MGLNRSSAGHIIAQLASKGLVRELPVTDFNRDGPARTGRPGILLELVSDAAIFLGVEIGVEHISVVKIDLSAKVKKLRGFPPDIREYLMFASPAYAQAAGAGAGGGIIGILPIVLIFAIMYFLMIRPQQKKMKEHRAMVEAVRRGDKVLTQGGILGKVTKVKEDSGEIEVEIAAGVKVQVLRHTLANVISKTEPTE